MTEPTFEQRMAQLEKLLQQLEKGELPLEASLTAFKEGMDLVKACRAQLDGVEMRVRKIVADSGESVEFDA
jgi:exodeoxyribonuclease VII small subunit